MSTVHLLSALLLSILLTITHSQDYCLPEFNTFFDIVRVNRDGKDLLSVVGMCTEYRLYQTEDWGKTWISVNVTAPAADEDNNTKGDLRLLAGVAASPTALVISGGVYKLYYKAHKGQKQWVEASLPDQKPYFFHKVRYLPEMGHFFAGASFGTILFSKDGITWDNVDRAMTPDHQEMYTFATNGKIVVAAGGELCDWKDCQGPVVYTNDITEFKQWYHANRVPYYVYCLDLVYSKKRDMFVCSGVQQRDDKCAIIYSKDGINWEPGWNCTQADTKFHGIGYSEEYDVFYAVGSEMRISRTGTKDWELVDPRIYPNKLGGPRWLTSIVLDKDVFIAVGNYNQVWLSHDQGISWKQVGPKVK